MKNVLVVLDPGHGGRDVGYQAGTVQEKDVNLAVCLAIRDVLERVGVDVLMTRTEDVTLSNEERITIANEQPVDLYVAWHCDLLADEKVSGISIWCHEDRTAIHQMDEWERIGDLLSRTTGQLMLGVFQDRDKVMEQILAPAIQIQGAFLSNPTERRLCTNAEFLKMQATGVAKGIFEYLNVGMTV